MAEEGGGAVGAVEEICHLVDLFSVLGETCGDALRLRRQGRRLWEEAREERGGGGKGRGGKERDGGRGEGWRGRGEKRGRVREGDS